VENAKPLIYLITDGTLNNENYYVESKKLLELIEVAINCGVSMIQLREKKITAGLLFNLTSEIINIRNHSNTKILLNDRADVALSAKADGVHLTTNSISAKIIHKNFPEDFLIGVSTHSIKEVTIAKNDGASFCVFSPIFYTPEKGEAKGLVELNKAVKAASGFPVLALGGINEENFADALKTGASGIAAIRFLNDKEKLPEIIDKINGVFNE
jgi:thiamine-phosphate pyrophosphorylase